jgi:hypothetical protein
MAAGRDRIGAKIWFAASGQISLSLQLNIPVRNNLNEAGFGLGVVFEPALTVSRRKAASTTGGRLRRLIVLPRGSVPGRL